MHTIIRGLGLLLFLGAAPFARAQDKAPDPKAEFEKLSEQFNAAQQEYYKPYQEAKNEEESRKIRLDPEKDPRKTFLAKFEDLAARAKGTDTGCDCWIWVFSNSYDDPQALQRSFDALGSEYVKSPALEGFVQTLGWMGEQVGREKADALMDKLLAESPHEGVRAAVLLTQASSVLQGRSDATEEQRKTARAKLDRLRSEFPKTRYAAEAAGMIFEFEHLQIGMEAPDFEAVDQDGKPWKLSDYRGKVVVVDFWGYW